MICSIIIPLFFLFSRIKSWPDYTGRIVGNGTATINGHFYHYIIGENGDWIAEGDIIIGSEIPLTGPRRLVPIINGLDRRWPNCEIPIQFGGPKCDTSDTPSQQLQQTILSAIEHWEQFTPVRFVWKGPEHTDYVYFCDSARKGCYHSSHVGDRQRGGQAIHICGTSSKIQRGEIGIIVHEIGHAFGFYHTQSRADRDRYIWIDYNNVRKDRIHNFDKHIHDTTDCQYGYDFSSIMHYSAYVFAMDKTKPSIIALNQSQIMGQRTGLSLTDISCATDVCRASGVQRSGTVSQSPQLDADENE